MKSCTRVLFILGFTLLCAPPGRAQEQGAWRAASKTAESITGDVIFSSEKLTINFYAFPLSQIRSLKSDEVLAAFDGADPAAGTGHLYRLNIAADRRFLHKNTLCGSDAVQWIATFVSGKDLRIDVFSGTAPPTMTLDAFNNSTTLCGSFSYTR